MATPKRIAALLQPILKQMAGKDGRGFNKDLHHKTGLSTGYLSEIIGGSKPGSQDAQMKICKALRINYNNLLMRCEQDADCNVPDNISTIEHEHVKVVKQFKQKELALEINQIMLEIEQNNPSLLKVIKSQLAGLANECYPAPVKKRTTGTDKD